MRSLAATLVLLASVSLAGCTSGSVADLEPIPTGSIAASKTARIAPPASLQTDLQANRQANRQTAIAAASKEAPVAAGQAISAAAASPAVLSWEGPEPNGRPDTHAFDAMTTTVGMPVPAGRPGAGPLVAMATPIPTILPRGTLNPMKRAGVGQRMEIYEHRFRDAKPINFGRASPRRLAVHGVDVSRWQGDIDWDTLRRQGANFAYIKATDGGDHIDPMFKTNWRKAREAGLKHGAYHFFYWCRTAGEQADWFIRNVPREPGALPPVIDVEYNGESSCKVRLSRATILEKIKVFADRLERHYGQRPVIYTAPDFYKDNLEGEMLEYPFWLRSVAAHPTKVYPGRKWLFWQYSGSGLSQGVQGKIDLNVFNGNEDDWHGWVASAN